MERKTVSDLANIFELRTKIIQEAEELKSKRKSSTLRPISISRKNSTSTASNQENEKIVEKTNILKSNSEFNINLAEKAENNSESILDPISTENLENPIDEQKNEESSTELKKGTEEEERQSFWHKRKIFENLSKSNEIKIEKRERSYSYLQKYKSNIPEPKDESSKETETKDISSSSKPDQTEVKKVEILTDPLENEEKIKHKETSSKRSKRPSILEIEIKPFKEDFITERGNVEETVKKLENISSPPFVSPRTPIGLFAMSLLSPTSEEVRDLLFPPSPINQVPPSYKHFENEELSVSKNVIENDSCQNVEEHSLDLRDTKEEKEDKKEDNENVWKTFEIQETISCSESEEEEFLDASEFLHQIETEEHLVFVQEKNNNETSEIIHRNMEQTIPLENKNEVTSDKEIPTEEELLQNGIEDNLMENIEDIEETRIDQDNLKALNEEIASIENWLEEEKKKESVEYTINSLEKVEEQTVISETVLQEPKNQEINNETNLLKESSQPVSTSNRSSEIPEDSVEAKREKLAKLNFDPMMLNPNKRHYLRSKSENFTDSYYTPPEDMLIDFSIERKTELLESVTKNRPRVVKRRPPTKKGRTVNRFTFHNFSSEDS